MAYRIIYSMKSWSKQENSETVVSDDSVLFSEMSRLFSPALAKGNKKRSREKFIWKMADQNSSANN